MGVLIAELVGFVLLLVALWRLVLPRVNTMLTDQQKQIKAQLDEGRAASERLRKAEAEYQKTVAEGSQVAASIRDEARADAVAIREEILAKANEDRDRLLAAGREQLVTERQALIRELRSELGAMTVDLARQILTESLEDEERQRGTVERFLTTLERETGDAPVGAGGRH
ncbi:MAG: F0F1 ATP synthase subunit B [Actinocatenispora sp.]